MRLAMFLRGINVGGRHRLPMADVRALLADLGAAQVATYIQSGNIVLTLPEAPTGPQAEAPTGQQTRSLSQLTERFGTALEERAGFPVPVHIRTAAALRAIRSACPYAPDDPRFCHIVLLDGAPDPERLAGIDARCAGSSTAVDVRAGAEGAVAYLLTPGGLSSSPHAQWVLAQLGGTARNLRTIDAVLARL